MYDLIALEVFDIRYILGLGKLYYYIAKVLYKRSIYIILVGSKSAARLEASLVAYIGPINSRRINTKG